ncbi:hypothetical protein PGTUg99_024606 [Puccinia graminis f. sp. tritici]|uniref:Uncharacterized protein n=1 Tax=Puccinia graminis f. sp. tritici TaxID=56615 RepID=A0A5B0S010_PUCGR|nr:hypothetical protein PGTUg99_024606 [Puccinia graminis f. sp. tritici]
MALDRFTDVPKSLTDLPMSLKACNNTRLDFRFLGLHPVGTISQCPEYLATTFV